MSEGNITMDLTEVNEEVDEQPLVSAPEEEEPEEVPEEEPEEVPEEEPVVSEEPVVEQPEEEPDVEEEPVVSEEPEEVPEPEPEPVVEEEPEPCLGDEIIVECGIHQGKTFTEVLPLLYEHYGNVDDVKVWIGKAPINVNALKYLDIWISENQ